MLLYDGGAWVNIDITAVLRIGLGDGDDHPSGAIHNRNPAAATPWA